MKPFTSATCVICGSRPATTRDHVPPKGLFKGQAVEPITVPACLICNNGGSSEDEDLRFYVSMQVGKQTPESAALWDQGAHKSLKRKTSLRTSVIATARDVQTSEASGQVGSRLAVVVPARTYQTVFERTTRGLYFHHTGRMLSSGTTVVVSPLEGVPDLRVHELTALAAHRIGGDSCVYRFAIVGDKHESSLWLYTFYGAHWVVVTTGDATNTAV